MLVDTSHMTSQKSRPHHAQSGWFVRSLMNLGIFACIICATRGNGQLTWGPNGNGGSGTWDTTTADWWNGSANVVWINGSPAIFAGTGGTVTSTFSGPTASDITFNSPGYTIQSGQIKASGATLNITTNQSATISSTFSQNTGVTLVKGGSATLTIAGTMFIPNIQVNAGEYLVGGSSSLFFSNVTLANSPGVTVTLGQTSSNASINSLSGGGASGGILQPDAQARTVTATLWATGIFSGVAQDNGSGKLAISVFAGSNSTVTFAGANTYSGATTIQLGTLALSQSGSVLNSAVTVQSSGVLQLDNSAVAMANRLSDTIALVMQSGRFNFIGNSLTAVDEQVGNLNFSGAASISNTQPGAAASLLTFSGATRVSNGTVDFSGTGRTKWNGIANDSSGIVGGYATMGNEWATVGGDGRISALATYATDINAASTGGHVKITGGGTTALAASVQRATLNLQNSSGTANTLDVGAGQTLTVGDGGILTSGTAASQIQNGTLVTGTGELVVTNRNALTITSAINDLTPGTGLTKSGAGVLTLTGTNGYSGVTAINQGTLVVSSDANLGTGSTIEFNGGTLQAAQSFISAKGFAIGSTFVGTINTAGFDLAFSGSNAGISKTGAGTLTLSNPAAGSVFINQGTVALPNPTSGTITLQGGTLLVAGNLTSLSLSASSTLDIGGPGAGTLTTGQFSIMGGSSPKLTLRFGLGSSASDLWTITSPIFASGIATGTFLCDLQNLGGATSGTNYTLMNVTESGPPLTPTMFGIAPSALAAGWNGSFAVSPTNVTLLVTNVPEPSSVLLIGIGVIVFCRRGRLR